MDNNRFAGCKIKRFYNFRCYACTISSCIHQSFYPNGIRNGLA